ncbi:MAG: ferrous iron transport protein B [Fervidobacterium sp.]|uniref:Ferrous iron transport protein B n=1 Tax=Fervidobacterium gondwanense DSM 13020 TaxID=1121883 RepID=A0A1M7SAS1_FERGO|nr:ferrous iron transport protein B [Fervidobacterium gondwanense]UXF00407.1 iron transporter FeoB [Fervidobacterium riparium]SHN55610.1 ferrous iron transport protein B [Fervidobacterium gondwanense DSM 13020]
MVITVGLLGNPNVGKTSLFNRLVGARQYVANWPGVTVSRIEGATTYEGYTLHFVDLPGVYTLTATSIDEKVTRDYLLFSPPNVTVVIIDSMSPEQGLFLLLEALELELNVVAVFNAIDEARKGGYKIDKAVLETFLRVPVILTSAHTGEGIDELKQKIVSAFKKPTRPLLIDYGKEVEERISEVEKCVMEGFNKRFTAIKVIEGDKFVSEFLSKDCQKQGQSEELQSSNMNSNPEKSDDSLATKIPSIKYEYINDVLQKAFQKTDSALTVTEALDHVLTHRFIGIPIFLALMYLAFNFTFKVSEPLVGLLEFLFGKLSEMIGSETMLSSLISQGIINGVGSVLAFVPSIFALFFALGIMEESGYLPRIAFLMDRIMYSLRLTGRSFMTLLLGFGCNVSTVMAARGLSDERERVTTILVSPFISCSARIPVYLLIISVAFPNHKAEAFFAIYVLSLVLTALSSRIINKVVLKGQNVPLVMELPRYRFPKISNVATYMWNRGRHFLEKAGTIIFVSSVVIWALSYFPDPANIENSYVSMLGKFLQPIFAPLNYTWQIVSALIFGGVAKEVIVSSLSQFYENASNIHLNPVVAASLMVFVLGYMPCFATLAAIKGETNSWKYTAFAVIYSLSISYILAFITYTIGRVII